jgi:6,7-dimethyl-8-ribityllumazine synthase
MKTWHGQDDARNLRFGIVVSRFNEFVTERLLAGAVEALGKAGAADDAIDVARVPGAFEIPIVARRMARSGRYDAVICLGAVIKGETPHFEYISAEAARGISAAGWEADIPVIFGVLTTHSVDQAIERAGAPESNRGAEAARTAIEMATLMQQLTSTKLTSGKAARKLASSKPTSRKRKKRS